MLVCWIGANSIILLFSIVIVKKKKNFFGIIIKVKVAITQSFLGRSWGGVAPKTFLRCLIM